MAGPGQLLPRAIAAALNKGKFVWIRAGESHRFIGIWVVVVNGRAFVRSWSLEPRSWYRTFTGDPHGAIMLEKHGREIPVRAVPVRSERLNDAISEAYVAKYNTPASLRYAEDLGSAKSRGATMELRPRTKSGTTKRPPPPRGSSARARSSLRAERR